MSYTDTIKKIINMYQLPDKFTDETLTDFVSEMGSLQSIWGFCSRDISDKDLSDVSDSTLFKIAFNNDTIWGKTDYPHDIIFEQMKNPGLSIEKLHKQSINGKDVNIAVIDKPILKTHSEFAGSLKDYKFVCDHERNEQMHFHGITCAAFACGKTTGTAPGANLYYFAYPDWFSSDGLYWDYHFQAFDKIIEHNRTRNDKIKIVSVSAGVPNTQQELLAKLNDYYTKMEQNGCYLIFSNLFGKTFTCASKIYGIDSDNLDCYKLDSWQQNPWDKERVLIPSGGRTSPCNSGNESFMYMGNQSCYSWAIPYVCGIFALAMQIKPDITYKQFCEIAVNTATINQSGLKIINPLGVMNNL